MTVDGHACPVLTSDAVVVPTDDGLIVSDGFGTHVIGGHDLARFAEPLIARFDGTSSLAGIAADTGTQPTHLHALAELLNKRGLVCLPGPDRPAQNPVHPLIPHGGALKSAAVIIYTDQHWGRQAAQLLNAENVGSVVTIDDCAERSRLHGDAIAVGPIEPTGARRRLETQIGYRPVAGVALAALDEALRGGADLLLIALEHSAIERHLAAAGLAIEYGIRHLCATLRGMEAIVGPYVVPGQGACWNCWRLREIACAAEPWAERIVHAHLQARGHCTHARNLTYAPTAAAALSARVARLVLGALAGLGTPKPSHVYVENLLACTSSVHKVMQMPSCQLCGGPSHPGVGFTGEAQPSGAEDDGPYRDWLDSRVGVVQDIHIRRTTIFPSLVRAYAITSDYGDDEAIGRACRPYTGFVDGCGGKGFTEQAAITGALGEAIERYSAGIRPHQTVTATIEELSSPVIPAHQLIHYTDAQYRSDDFGYRFPDGDTPLAWTAAQWLDDSGQVWVPADLAYYRPGSQLAQVTSNGLAAGLSYSDAACRAVLEAVERDAFLRTWVTRSAPPRIDIDPQALVHSPNLTELTAQMCRAGLNVNFYQLAAAVDVTVVLAVALADRSPWPAATVATAAHVDPFTAVENAALELAYTIIFLREVLESGNRRVPSHDSDVRTFLDHALRYSQRSTVPRLSFITDSPHRVTLATQPTSAPGDLAALRRRIDVPIALADVTSPDVALTGVRVVRALSPTLTPLWCGDGMQRIAHLAGSDRHLSAIPHPMC